jgi:5'(3')-deoxyribonucleotidase
MPGFFRSLLPMEGAMSFWKTYVDKADLYFLTRPSFQNRQCYTEKADWVFRYLGEEGVKRLIISPRKDFLIGDILIDDSTNCGQNLFQGEWWQFGSETCPNWSVASELLAKKLFTGHTGYGDQSGNLGLSGYT